LCSIKRLYRGRVTSSGGHMRIMRDFVSSSLRKYSYPMLPPELWSQILRWRTQIMSFGIARHNLKQNLSFPVCTFHGDIHTHQVHCGGLLMHVWFTQQDRLDGLWQQQTSVFPTTRDIWVHCEDGSTYATRNYLGRRTPNVTSFIVV